MKRAIYLATLLSVMVMNWAGAQTQPTTSRDADMAPAIPPGGTPIVAEDSTAVFRRSAKPDEATLQVVDVSGQKFAKATRFQTIKQPAHAWDVQLLTNTTAAVEKGDVLLASFFIRGVESACGEGQAVFVFERAGPPYDKSAEFLVGADKTWKQVFVPFTSREAYAAGKASINFQLGFTPQTVEIASISVVNYGKKVKIDDLPIARYPGWEPDALWRKAAAERIEKIRKADLTVIVTGGQGKPLVNADVQVKMTRHTFAFGSVVAAKLIIDKTEAGQKYRDFVQQHFSRVVFGNDLKWATYGWENPDIRKQMFEAFGWLQEKRIDVRGHCLVWPSWKYMSKEAEKLKGDPAALRKLIADHVTEEVSAMKGKLVEWDVINEPYTNHDAMDILGNEVMADWFKLARAADPKAELFINDYSILAHGGLDHAHQDHYEKTLHFLLDQGAPLDGIGMQGHFDSQLTPPERMLAILDRFAKLGKPIEVTEFDVNVTNERLQADFTRDFLTTLFSHPSVKGIVMWGFWEGSHWKPNNAALVRRDWTLKPNGQVWMDLVERQWWTNERGKTGPAGEYKIRGFLGDYKVGITADGKEKSASAKLTKSGLTVTITMD